MPIDHDIMRRYSLCPRHTTRFEEAIVGHVAYVQTIAPSGRPVRMEPYTYIGHTADEVAALVAAITEGWSRPDETVVTIAPVRRYIPIEADSGLLSSDWSGHHSRRR